MPSHSVAGLTGRSPHGSLMKPCLYPVILFLVAAAADSDAFAQVANPIAPHKNRLAEETSPYLLQHAENPVDWYPWGTAALEKARREDKVIFLSIGYSSCHWCHVMEHESFTDAEIARYMNDRFVCIKVDREERPDIDAIYMLAVQLLTGRGGWPLSVFLTPDGQPFFGGTYFPARDGDRGPSSGFLTVLRAVNQAWETERANVAKRSAAVADQIRQVMKPTAASQPSSLGAEIVDRTLVSLRNSVDPEYGGFGYSPTDPGIPKFPQSSTLAFLADQAFRVRHDESRAVLLKTLDEMARGGIRDHLGGGFHRYAVDRYWHIPHFEKMLYDNGQLLSVFAEAFAATGNEEYRRVIEELVDWLDRDMTSPTGAFYAAIDADSEGEEGKFYRWKRQEWDTLLGANDARLFASVYASSGQPNFETDYYVPLLRQPKPQLAADRDLSEQALEARLLPLRRKLLQYRENRPRPMTDSKLLTGWNGLMIRGLADAGRALQRTDYTQRAGRAATFVLEHLRKADGSLQRTFSQGEARLNAYLDDYAFLVDGLLALHRATDDPAWLQMAKELTERQINLFWDAEGLGFFFTSSDHEQLIVRGKLLHEGARPSGAAAAAENLVYLAKVLHEPAYAERARQTMDSAAGMLTKHPAEVPRMVQALAKWLALAE